MRWVGGVQWNTGNDFYLPENYNNEMGNMISGHPVHILPIVLVSQVTMGLEPCGSELNDLWLLNIHTATAAI